MHCATYITSKKIHIFSADYQANLRWYQLKGSKQFIKQRIQNALFRLQTDFNCFQSYAMIVCQMYSLKLLNQNSVSVVVVHTSLTQNVSYALNIASSLKTLTANRAIWLDLFWPKMDINLTIISFDGAPTFCHNKLLPYEFGWVYSTEQKNTTTTTKSVGMSETPLHNEA